MWTVVLQGDIPDLSQYLGHTASDNPNLTQNLGYTVSTAQVPGASLAVRGFFAQTWVLLLRQSYLAIKDPSVYISRCIMFVILNCFFSIIYIDSRTHNLTQLQAPRPYA